ncbi:hypothetical protein KJ632_00005, partial [Patescibacteria group bacterium]|nr:hypothetical protein [Patescibacteria group bacterium]
TLFFGLFMPLFFLILFPNSFLIAGIWLTVGFAGMLYHFIDWYYDAWLLTNFGILDIEKNGLFDKTSTRIEYHMIEGISYTVKGFIPTILNYGDITIDKMGAQTSVILKEAAAPKQVERMIMKYQERFVTEKSYRDHSALKDMLSEMIAYHIQNKKIKK